MMNNFSINVDDTYSFGRLKEMKEAGKSVQRILHLGNQGTTGLITLGSGIPCIIFDRNRTINDKNYHPEVIIRGGEAIQELTSSEKLCTHVPGTGKHFESIRRAFPEANIQTTTEEIAQINNRYGIEEIIHWLIDETVDMGIWNQRVDERGDVHTEEPGNITANRIKSDGVFQIGRKGNASGWLLPKEIYIVLSAVFSAISIGEEEQFHLSGSKMYIYMPTLSDKLSKIYALLKSKYEHELPDRFKLTLIPTAHNRFGGNPASGDALSQLIEKIQSSIRFKKERGAKIKAASQDGKEEQKRVAESFHSQTNRVVQGVQQAYAHLESEWPIYKPNMDGFTQYDIPQEGMYIHSIALNATMRELNQIATVLDQTEKRVAKIEKRRYRGPIAMKSVG